MRRGERQCHIGSWREMSGPGLSWGEAGLGWRCEKKQVKRVRYKVTRESKAGNSQAGPADDDCDKMGRHGRARSSSLVPAALPAGCPHVVSTPSLGFYSSLLPTDWCVCLLSPPGGCAPALPPAPRPLSSFSTSWMTAGYTF